MLPGGYYGSHIGFIGEMVGLYMIISTPAISRGPHPATITITIPDSWQCSGKREGCFLLPFGECNTCSTIMWLGGFTAQLVLVTVQWLSGVSSSNRIPQQHGVCWCSQYGDFGVGLHMCLVPKDFRPCYWRGLKALAGPFSG